MKRTIVCGLFLLGMFAAHADFAEEMSLAELRMEKRFGFGFSAAGPLAILGMEVDINLTEEISVSGGIGTGLDYSTFMVKGKYLLLGESVSPYFGLGFARWWSGGTSADKVGPSVLTNEFLEPGQDLSDGFSVYMAYPVLGVQFMHPIGLGVFAELQYLFKLFSLANGTYAGIGMHWYF